LFVFVFVFVVVEVRTATIAMRPHFVLHLSAEHKSHFTSLYNVTLQPDHALPEDNGRLSTLSLRRRRRHYMVVGVSAPRRHVVYVVRLLL
jgi:hypothetical protein